MQLIMQLRNMSGCGLEQCRIALEKCNDDLILALGYLKYDGCAVSVKNYDDWVMQMAQKFKDEYIVM